MKFRYYITDLHAGCIFGTNDKEVAESYATSEDNFVVDTECAIQLLSDGESMIIEELGK